MDDLIDFDQVLDITTEMSNDEFLLGNSDLLNMVNIGDKMYQVQGQYNENKAIIKLVGYSITRPCISLNKFAHKIGSNEADCEIVSHILCDVDLVNNGDHYAYALKMVSILVKLKSNNDIICVLNYNFYTKLDAKNMINERIDGFYGIELKGSNGAVKILEIYKKHLGNNKMITALVNKLIDPDVIDLVNHIKSS